MLLQVLDNPETHLYEEVGGMALGVGAGAAAAHGKSSMEDFLARAQALMTAEEQVGVCSHNHPPLTPQTKTNPVGIHGH